MPIIELTIPGIPIAKARPRFVRRGKFVGTYNCQRHEEDRFILLANPQIKKRAPRTEPVNLRCVFCFPVPKSKSNRERLRLLKDGKHIVKPDLDNCVKYVKDCLNGIAWDDDCQVCSVVAEKRYHTNPGTFIEIEWNERVRIETIPGVKIKPQKYMGEG